MRNQFSRRELIGAAALGLSLGSVRAQSNKPVRLGVIGTGNRGTSLLRIALLMDGVEIPALCDVNKENLAKAQDVVATSGRKTPEGYSGGEEDYKRLIDRDDLDGVLIATPWEFHTPIAVYSMKAGKYTGSEVPIAISIEQCWELLNTQEQTRTPCMMLENWSFRRDNLAVLKMIREGLFGELNYCHCAYGHDCTDVWFFDKDGKILWPGSELLKRNADQYPTHGLGPVISWMDIDCGDYPAYLTSTASRAISEREHFAKKFGPNHPACKLKYKQGDVVTTVVKTIKGKTIVIKNDMQSPRPYGNEWVASGTNGIYDERANAVYIDGVSPKEEQWDPFPPYQAKYDHPWYKEIDSVVGTLKTGVVSHGGPDYLEVKLFVEAVRDKKPMPLDIYDSIIMCAPIPLSEQSIARGSAPVPFPDFTRGKWKTNKPYFGVVA